LRAFASGVFGLPLPTLSFHAPLPDGASLKDTLAVSGYVRLGGRQRVHRVFATNSASTLSIAENIPKTLEERRPEFTSAQPADCGERNSKTKLVLMRDVVPSTIQFYLSEKEAGAYKVA
jgi:hypothetical protein